MRYNTNRRLSHDAAAGSRHSSALPSFRKLNLRFVVKTTTLVREARAPAVSEVCFLLFTSKLVCSTKMSKLIRETRARIADTYGNIRTEYFTVYFYAFRQQTQSKLRI